MIIRQLTAGDLAAYRALHRFGISESPSGFVDVEETDAARSDEVVAATLARGEAWGVFDGERLLGKLTIDAPDVAAVFVTLQARLIPDRNERPDDRQQARLLIQIGADYSPARNTPVSAFAPASYNPGVGVSRAKRVTDTWNAFNFATIDVGVQDPGGAAISVAEFRSAPPPLE